MKKIMIPWIPAILFMIVIYIFSSKPGEESSEGSMAITKILVEGYERIINVSLEEAERIDFGNQLEFFVRKGAHMTEFALLGAAIAYPLWCRRKRGWQLFFLTWGFTVFYAATDEFHQKFVPGRTGRVFDVLIDGLGAIFGILGFIAFQWYLQKRKQPKKNS